MKYVYEPVKIQSNIPAKIILHNNNNNQEDVPPHWHRSLELTWVSEGEFLCYINGEHIDVKSREVLLINSWEIHSMHLYGVNHVQE